MNAESIGKLIGSLMTVAVCALCVTWLATGGPEWLPKALAWYTLLMGTLTVGIALGEPAKPKPVDLREFIEKLRKERGE